jgi:hypothetical protein
MCPALEMQTTPRSRMALLKRNTLQDFPRSISIVLRVCPNQMIPMTLLVGGPIAMTLFVATRSLLVATLLAVMAAATITALMTRPHAISAACVLSYCSSPDAE